MRVYVFGGDKERCIGVANLLNEKGGTAIIGSNLEFGELAGKIGKEFDYAVTLSNKPIAAAIEANREGKLRAAVCYSQRNIDAAIEAGTNVFVLDQNNREFPNLAVLLSSGRSRGASFENAEERKERPAFKLNIKRPERKQAKPQDDPKEDEEDEEDDEREDRPAASGITGKIKDVFGIE